MIEVTKANQKRLMVNAELIVTVEGAHDTIVSLTTGEKLLVLEPVDLVVERILAYRRSLQPARCASCGNTPQPGPRLLEFPTPEGR